jgi:hypothetical protein
LFKPKFVILQPAASNALACLEHTLLVFDMMLGKTQHLQQSVYGLQPMEADDVVPQGHDVVPQGQHTPKQPTLAPQEQPDVIDGQHKRNLL